MRIVSLLPSATEIVCSLGLGDQLVAVTHECDFPDFVRGLPKATRTLVPKDAPSGEIDRLVRERLAGQTALYSLDLETLEALRPDLIVTQALCDVCAVAEREVQDAACALPGRPPVVNLEPETLAQVYGAIRLVAEAAGIPARGEEPCGDSRRASRRWPRAPLASSAVPGSRCWSGSTRRSRAATGTPSWCASPGAWRRSAARASARAR